MSKTQRVAGVLELQWERGLDEITTYYLYEVEPSGQRSLVSYMDQGPFDTALEVAQWAWRAISRVVPPATT